MRTNHCRPPVAASTTRRTAPVRLSRRGSGRRAILTLLVLAALALPAQAMEITDALGRPIRIALPIRRVVALNSDALEILRTLKAQDRVVGVYSEIVREPAFWGALVDLPKAGGWSTPNLEAIAAMDPDLVLAYSRNPGEELDRKMGALGIPVLRLDFYKLTTLESDVRQLGHLLGQEAAAQAFCDWHSAHLALLHERVAPISRHPAVYIESYSDLATIGPISGAHEMCQMAGGRNIAAGMALPYPKVTAEWVVSQNPDVIVKAAAWGNGYEATDAAGFNTRRDAIMNRPVWSEIPAVKSGRVHVMDSAIWTGPRALIGIAWLTRWFFPDRFTDVDPDQWHADYLKRFQGVTSQGVFVSDPVPRVNP